MLRPSYSELMEVLNDRQELDNKISSRYTIVIAAAKRARMLIDGEKPLTEVVVDKAVSIAVKEMYEGYINITLNSNDNENMENQEEIMKADLLLKE